MLKKAYYWFHRKMSPPKERGEYSSGLWQDAVRTRALDLCRSERGRLLEVGCGEGLFLARLIAQKREVSVYGVDIREDMLARAGEKLKGKDVKLSLVDGASMPFNDDFFDTVVCVNVFFNLPSEEIMLSVIEEIVRVCRKGGRTIFDIRNSRNPLLCLKYKLAKVYDGTIKDLPLKTYDKSRFVMLLREKGLEVISSASVGMPGNFLAPIFIIEARKI